jgi:phospho-N-acetylmuramoyl-pentapeptide-transferase
MLTTYLISLISTFVITAVSLRFLIPYLKSKKMGQKILDIGPRWHKSKEGTPTMGGLSFLVAVVIVLGIIFGVLYYKSGSKEVIFALISLAFASLNALIGIIDDRTKFSKNKNEGLLSWQKYLLQLAVTVGFIIACSALGFITTELYIPFIGKTIELGFLYYIFAAVLITGMINSVNLADGIDGLAASETVIVSAFFSAYAFVIPCVTLGAMAGATLGACLGFLVYNFYPARVFMGDTGSLFLGALVSAMAFMSGKPLIVVVCGFMYVAEALSDIIQVVYFKLTHGKRFFKMAPIHHHFEKCGWSEIKVVTVFSAITLVLCAVSFVFDVL